MLPELLVRTLRHVWTTLEDRGVPTAVIGGIALAQWEHIRATQDVDLLAGIEADQVDSIVQALRAANVRTKHDPPVVALGEAQAIPLLYEPPETALEVQIVLLLARSEYHQQALARRVSAPLPALGMNIKVVSCEDLILLKLIAGRAIDRADAAALVRANSESLEGDYLRDWSRGLHLDAALADVWDEAFPGQAPPA